MERNDGRRRPNNPRPANEQCQRRTRDMERNDGMRIPNNPRPANEQCQSSTRDLEGAAVFLTGAGVAAFFTFGAPMLPCALVALGSGYIAREVWYGRRVFPNLSSFFGRDLNPRLEEQDSDDEDQAPAPSGEQQHR